MNENRWQKIVNDLLNEFTQKEIADAINASQARISNISTGEQKKVSHEDGEALIALHKITFTEDTPCVQSL